MDLRLALRILGAYPSWLTRAYLVGRLSIIRWIMADILLNLPERGLVVNLGSGIGLFDIYCAHHRPDLQFVGLDIDERRIRLSTEAARRLGVANVRFAHGDVSHALPDVQPTVVIALDLLHHLHPDVRVHVLDWIAAHLSPDGTLFIKDIDVQPRWRVRFTKVLDDLMTGGEPTWYFGPRELRRELSSRGFATSAFHLRDYIPFPHIIYVAHRRQPPAV